MLETMPLLAHRDGMATLAYRHGSPITAQRFLADARALAARLPAGQHVLNVCADRYRFAVGFAACLLSRRVSLLPSTHTPEVIQQLKLFAPDVYCLTDDVRCDISLPLVCYPDDPAPDCDAYEVPQIPALQVAAIVFTSGSTGVPLPHTKRWGPLARCVLSGAPWLGLLDGRVHTLVGTVPVQHMYGLESSLLLALLSGNAFCAERPFYPADVAAAVAAVPAPRVLVTTPVHLRTLLAAEIDFPPVGLVLSATAPLSQELAQQVEQHYATTLQEIYGSTETGQIALRRSAHGNAWQLWPGVHLHAQDEQTFAEGGHIEQRTALCDVIELLDARQFLLHGRLADLVNVAGKRSSLGYLNAQLNAISGVEDGAFFLREDSGETGVARLGAVVVAPGMSSAAIIEQLRLRIDPVFLPRPLLLVEQLPRNATGKLPRQALQGLADSLKDSGVT